MGQTLANIGSAQSQSDQARFGQQTSTAAQQQALNQQILDAQRATQLQQAYAPYQAVGFLSDVYRGAPSTQMSTAVSSQPSASPFQQAVGIGLGALSTAAGAKKAGLL
jgi:2-keto-3-deoxy-galactonokinase